MANANRGEVALKVGDKEYTLRFSANALCDLESVLKMPILEVTKILDDPSKLSMTMVRAMMWAGLKEKQPRITIEQAGDIVQELSLMAAFAEIGNAFKIAFPTPDHSGPQELDSQASGTGPASSVAGLN